jgi:hypothetical protein
MSKTAIKYVVKLNRIPDRFVSNLLDFKGIGKLELVHKKSARFLESSYSFMERRVPALRLSDKHFVFNHILDEATEVPTLKVFDREMKLRETIEPGTLTETELTDRLLDVDSKLKMSH